MKWRQRTSQSRCEASGLPGGVEVGVGPHDTACQLHDIYPCRRGERAHRGHDRVHRAPPSDAHEVPLLQMPPQHLRTGLP